MDQLDLFASAPVSTPNALSERLAREHAEAREIARGLPTGVRFGTSSWSFPGWEGLVYSRRATASQLAREGLREYAAHPLLTTVGIDRSFYAPIPPADLDRYAAQLPSGFPCCAKAPEAVTAVVLAEERSVNPDYLRPERFLEEVLVPFREHFLDHVGPFLFQFPPAPASMRPQPGAFAERLERFLAALPKGYPYAVELRDPTVLTAEYRQALAAHGVAHVCNYATAMPMPAEQERIVPLETAGFAVVRLLLRPGTRYDERREEFEPFDRIVDESGPMRRDVVDLVGHALSLGREVFVLVNNKAEGCSPLTIRALAEMLAVSPQDSRAAPAKSG